MKSSNTLGGVMEVDPPLWSQQPEDGESQWATLNFVPSKSNQ